MLIVCEKPAVAERVVEALHPEFKHPETSSLDPRAKLKQLACPELQHTWHFDGIHEDRPVEFTVTGLRGHLYHTDFEEACAVV